MKKRKSQAIVCISLTPTLLRQIDRLAKAGGLSRSAFVRQRLSGRKA